MGRFRPEGIFVALVTPTDRKGRVDEEGLRELVDFVVEEGVSGVAPCGTPEELSRMDEKERMRALEVVLDHVSSGVQVIASSGVGPREMAIRMARHAEDVGADALAVSGPGPRPAHARGLYQYYLEVLRATELPIVLHHAPQQTGSFLDQGFIEYLTDVADVRAVEEGSGYLPYMLELMDSLGDRLAILCGHDEAVLPALASGASGAVLASANVVPGLWVRLFRAVRVGDLRLARRLQMSVLRLVKMLTSYGGVQAIKVALELVGLRAGAAPTALTREVREELRAELERIARLGVRET